jgi:hypothetical protein
MVMEKLREAKAFARSSRGFGKKKKKKAKVKQQPPAHHHEG